jgi:hypothetical protein
VDALGRHAGAGIGGADRFEGVQAKPGLLHENIRVVEMTLADLAALAETGGLTDLKTLTLVLALRAPRRRAAPDILGGVRHRAAGGGRRRADAPRRPRPGGRGAGGVTRCRSSELAGAPRPARPWLSTAPNTVAPRVLPRLRALGQGSHPAVAGAGSLVMGFGMGLLSTAALVLIQEIVPWSQRGSATASNVFAVQRAVEERLHAGQIGRQRARGEHPLQVLGTGRRAPAGEGCSAPPPWC